MINPDTNYICRWYGKILHIFNPVYEINYYYISTRTFGEFRRLMKRNFGAVIDRGNREGHFTIITKKRSDIDIGVIWVKSSADLGTLAHECFHAAYWTSVCRGLNKVSSDSEEAFAYMIGFLVKTIREARRSK